MIKVAEVDSSRISQRLPSQYERQAKFDLLSGHTIVLPFDSGANIHPYRGKNMHRPPPLARQRPTLYLVYATLLADGSTVEDTVAARDEDEAYLKARALYPRDRYDVTVYLQSADDD